MSKILFLSCLPFYFHFSSCISKTEIETSRPECKCDTTKTKDVIFNKDFNRIVRFDTASFLKSDFYTLDSSTNSMLWYRDVENIDSTKFTNLWNDYHLNNYHASNTDFINHYQSRKDIEMAFQLGPNSDLWAYHIFIIKKIECCYLITRSYFRHARFTYKAYSIIDELKLDTLYSIFKKINTIPVASKTSYGYAGFFADNRNQKTFCIDFEKEKIEIRKDGKETSLETKKEIEEFYNFIDKKIHWKITYDL